MVSDKSSEERIRRLTSAPVSCPDSKSSLESGSIAWTLLKSPFPAVKADFNALTELPIRTRSFLASFMEATISSAKSSFFPSTVS